MVAGITGRGDDPTEPFDLGLWGNAPIGTVMTRWRRFLAAFPEFPAASLAHQVHGSHLLWHQGEPLGWTLLPDADGHATASAGRLLLVTVADCVPVYLVAPRQRVIALLHAGWRGTAAEILARGVALLGDRAGVEPTEIVGHAGVAISGSQSRGRAMRWGRKCWPGWGWRPPGQAPGSSTSERCFGTRPKPLELGSLRSPAAVPPGSVRASSPTARREAAMGGWWRTLGCGQMMERG